MPSVLNLMFTMQLGENNPVPILPTKSDAPLFTCKQFKLLTNVMGMLLLDAFLIEPILLKMKAPEKFCACIVRGDI
jgi:hypothetical protein